MSRVPLLDHFYREFLQHEDSAEFIATASKHYSVGSLIRLAEYGQRVSRRAAALALGLVADYACNDVLGRALHDQDRAVRLIAENGLRNVWLRDGEPAQRIELSVIARKLHHNDFATAHQRATRLIDDAPYIAEAWNQRAVAGYALERIRESADDCHQALEINPYHFPAAIGMAHCYLEMNDATTALSCFQRALRLHPGLDAVRVQVEFLQRSLEEK